MEQKGAEALKAPKVGGWNDPIPFDQACRCVRCQIERVLKRYEWVLNALERTVDRWLLIMMLMLLVSVVILLAYVCLLPRLQRLFGLARRVYWNK